MAITDWPADERPREKLLAHGAGHLSDAELLAIFLRVGLQGKSAVDLARELLAHFGSLSALVAAPLRDFESIKGIGEAKFTQLQATVELARRALGEELRAAPVFKQPQALRDYVQLKLQSQPQECFYLLLLAADLRLIYETELSRGTVTQTAVYPREIAKLALHHNASAVVVAHNHPQGTASPSQADITLTQQLKSTLQILDVVLMDHLIVGRVGVCSMAELGLMG